MEEITITGGGRRGGGGGAGGGGGGEIALPTHQHGWWKWAHHCLFREDKLLLLIFTSAHITMYNLDCTDSVLQSLVQSNRTSKMQNIFYDLPNEISTIL